MNGTQKHAAGLALAELLRSGEPANNDTVLKAFVDAGVHPAVAREWAGEARRRAFFEQKRRDRFTMKRKRGPRKAAFRHILWTVVYPMMVNSTPRPLRKRSLVAVRTHYFHATKGLRIRAVTKPGLRAGVVTA